MIDETMVRILVGRFGVVVRQHYSDDTPSRDRLLELLNALAITTATILAGTAPPREIPLANDFFLDALGNQLESLLAEAVLTSLADRSS